MKPNRKSNYLYMSAVAFIILITGVSCGQPNNNISAIDSALNTDIINEPGDFFLSSELSEEEIEGLLFMREEEKLARDVYLNLSEVWGLPVFSNIARSETQHTKTIESLLDRYDLEDPADSTDAGVFTNPTLQELYNQLVEEGSRTLVDALIVGATVEEIDILDLEEYIAQTNQEDIAFVYNNLMEGSRNHLRAFVSTLESQSGETYQPQFLDQDDFAAIMNKAAERGERGNGGKGYGKGGNWKNWNP